MCKHVPVLYTYLLVMILASLMAFFHISDGTFVSFVPEVVHTTATMCTATHNHTSENHSLLKIWQNRSQSIVETMEPFLQPTTDAPFIFFHQRKAGGTSIRQLVFNTFKNNSWVPCLSARCVPWNPPPHSEQGKSVAYASHLNYVSMRQFTRQKVDKGELETDLLENGTLAKVHKLNDTHFGSCLTNIRSTIKRVVSCWNYRMIDERRREGIVQLPAANELSALDWAKLLPTSYSIYSEGCNNEIFRTMGSAIDEPYINTISPDHPSFSYEFNKTANHLSKCVIVMNERCEDSNKIIAYFLPWLGEVDICKTWMNKGQTGPNATELVANASEAILKNNQMDELLFQFGVSLFEHQLKAASEQIREG